ncbi:uncharacterized protein TNCV_1353341 [Trichonephila clavipes]|nr:uncharacterized protein TNCV_1353341 [Trichonephila clavipes]
MRGGICFLGKRHDKANNPYVVETYNEKKPHNYIVALDANNLYGYVMSQPLPIGNFSWLTPEEINDFNVFNYDQNSKVEFVIEVDLRCPKHLQLQTNDLPLAPKHLNITYDMLSPYSKRLCDKFNLRHTLPSKKLTPNFYPKENYITHYLNLQFYIDEGMIVEKYHRILAFSQRPLPLTVVSPHRKGYPRVIPEPEVTRRLAKHRYSQLRSRQIHGLFIQRCSADFADFGGNFESIERRSVFIPGTSNNDLDELDEDDRRYRFYKAP